jgi:hypothetical protein
VALVGATWHSGSVAASQFFPHRGKVISEYKKGLERIAEFFLVVKN